MDYTAYTFTVNPPQPGTDILIALLADEGFESFEVNDTGFIGYAPGKVGIPAYDFDFEFSWEAETIAARNWNAEWESSFQPVKVNDRLSIRAPFHASTGTELEIVIMPKMSFGTGHHQTTRLMCSALLGINLQEKRVLDMGCGTGVLAILACKLGAKSVTGVDIDTWSIENARENCDANGCPQISLLLGEADVARGTFDVIVANINRNILARQLPDYARLSKPGTILLLSGFFSSDEPMLAEAAGRCGFVHESSWAEEGWAAMRFIKA